MNEIIVAIIGLVSAVVVAVLPFAWRMLSAIHDSVNHRHPDDQANGKGLRDISVETAVEIGKVHGRLDDHGEKIDCMKTTIDRFVERPPCVHPDGIRGELEETRRIAQEALDAVKFQSVVKE